MQLLCTPADGGCHRSSHIAESNRVTYRNYEKRVQGTLGLPVMPILSRLERLLWYAPGSSRAQMIKKSIITDCWPALHWTASGGDRESALISFVAAIGVFDRSCRRSLLPRSAICRCGISFRNAIIPTCTLLAEIPLARRTLVAMRAVSPL
jgi:hypothetical protein